MTLTLISFQSFILAYKTLLGICIYTTMESSSRGRLGLQQVFPKNFEWKGKTFSEISSTVIRNKQTENTASNYTPSVFFRSQPLSHYRREIATVSAPTQSRYSTNIQSFEVPGGTILRDFASLDITQCNGIEHLKDFNHNEQYQPCTACDTPLEGAIDSTFVRSLSTQDNARRRVRSGGMNRTKFLANKNNTKNYYSSSSQYLHGRNKTFKQNQFNNLRVEGTHSDENVYASNTTQSCGTDADGNTQYVPVYYKPNNAKFANQGGVSASTRLVRLKYDTITDGGASMTGAFGKQTANAMAYGVPVNGYTIKDKIGYPNKCSYKFSAAHPDGIRQDCK